MGRRRTEEEAWAGGGRRRRTRGPRPAQEEGRVSKFLPKSERPEGGREGGMAGDLTASPSYCSLQPPTPPTPPGAEGTAAFTLQDKTLTPKFPLLLTTAKQKSKIVSTRQSKIS